MTKEQIRCVKDGLSRQKLYIALGCIEELEKENEELRTKYLQATNEGTSWAHLKSLEKENEQLKARVSYLEDNLRVARKDRERLQDDVANGLEEFIKEKPATSLRLLANKEVREENEQLKQQIAKMKQDVK